MTWQEVADAVKETKTILIPIGSTENGGPHLPLSNETEVALEIARKAGYELGSLVAPPIYFGASEMVFERLERAPESCASCPVVYSVSMTLIA